MISYIIISICGLLLVGLDQLTKYLIMQNVPCAYEGISVIKNFFEIVHWHNTGAAWGMFSDNTIALAIVSVFCMALLIFIFAQTKSVFLKCSLMLLISGACGNMIDRIARKFVVDFLHFYNLFGFYDFPAFNVADICVTLGAASLLVYLIFLSVKQKAFRDNTLCDRFFRDKEEKKTSEEIVAKE